MPVRHAHWYTLNAARDYPVDETASCVSDAGARLPTDILVDLRLRWPSYLGTYGFVSAVSVTAYAVSVTFQAATTLDNAGAEHVPLAVVTVPLADLQVGRAYALAPQVTGVYGYAVFGNGVTRSYQGRFSSPQQGWLTPRAARPYRDLPVTGLKRIGVQTALTGLVLLKGESPVEVVRETMELDGIPQDVAVVRLVQDDTNTENVFAKYAGPCGQRPESRSCDDPQPIEFINAVGPDCDGVVEIEFQGCAIAGQLVDDGGNDGGGVVLDCALGLSDSCLPPYLPHHDGQLPTEYRDYGDVAGTEELVSEYESESAYEFVLGELPYQECFIDGVADDFSLISGDFTFEEDLDRPDPTLLGCGDIPYDELNTYATLSLSALNISLWAGFDISTLFRTYTLSVSPIETTAGAITGGLVLNWQPHPTITGKYVYHLVMLGDTNLTVYYFDGTTMNVVDSTAHAATFGTWYTLTVNTWWDSGQAWLQVDAPVALGPTALPNFGDDTGMSGVGSYYGKARFAQFKVEVYTP